MQASELGSRELIAALEEVGHVEGAPLVEARLQLHHAVQVVAAVGSSFVPPRDDFSHTNLHWQDAGHLLLGRATPGDDAVQAGLSLPGLSLRLRSATGHMRASFDLPGRTLDEAYEWMRHAVEQRTDLRAPDGALVRPSHDLPDHAVADGEPFGGVSEPALSELAHWYGAADRLVRAAARRVDGASDVVVWPHHFDLASLVTLSGTGETATTIGLGFSPGDGGIDEPYFYVTPWPAPEAATLPALSVGRWNTEGWTGAVLRASQIAGAPDGTLRAEMLTTFLAEAHAAAHGVVRRG